MPHHAMSDTGVSLAHPALWDLDEGFAGNSWDRTSHYTTP